MADRGMTTGSRMSPIVSHADRMSCCAPRMLTPGPLPESSAESSATSEAVEMTLKTDSLPLESAATVVTGATKV